MTLTAPRRSAPTYDHYGRETYHDTGRPVDEQFGSHVVLWIVDGPEAWAAAIEAEGDAELDKWSKKDRHIAEARRAQRYEGAAKVRADGPRRDFRNTHHDAAAAAAEVAGLYRAHPNPGVRYEVAEITDVSACSTCYQPTIKADGQWRHHTGGFPAVCAPKPEPAPEEKEREPGTWEIGIGGSGGYMVCNYCDETVRWTHMILGHGEMTGFYSLGVHLETGELVVLAEATTLGGEVFHLPHHCKEIPDDVRTTWEPERQAIFAARGETVDA
jgi:hypothetical protein